MNKFTEWIIESIDSILETLKNEFPNVNPKDLYWILVIRPEESNYDHIVETGVGWSEFKKKLPINLIIDRDNNRNHIPEGGSRINEQKTYLRVVETDHKEFRKNVKRFAELKKYFDA